MRTLIVEDEFTSRMQLQYFLAVYGKCDIAVNGTEAVEAFKLATDAKNPYDLICLDIGLPGKDGHQALKEIRDMEMQIGKSRSNSAKIFMTTAMGDMKTIIKSYHELCDEYMKKPIDKETLDEMLKKHKLVV